MKDTLTDKFGPLPSWLRHAYLNNPTVCAIVNRAAIGGYTRALLFEALAEMGWATAQKAQDELLRHLRYSTQPIQLELPAQAEIAATVAAGGIPTLDQVAALGVAMVEQVLAAGHDAVEAAHEKAGM